MYSNVLGGQLVKKKMFQTLQVRRCHCSRAGITIWELACSWTGGISSGIGFSQPDSAPATVIPITSRKLVHPSHRIMGAIQVSRDFLSKPSVSPRGAANFKHVGAGRTSDGTSDLAVITKVLCPIYTCQARRRPPITSTCSGLEMCGG